MKYEISDHVVHNIKEFLSRSDLKGSEVPAYVEILNALSNPVVETSDSVLIKE